MDPLIRMISDVRRLRNEVSNPFSKEEVIEYFCKLAEEMGFKAVKNLRHNGTRVDCGWKDGNSIFLAVNVEYGSEREILGAVAEIMVVDPEIGVLVTASNPMKPMTSIIDAIKRITTVDFIIIDVRTGNSATVRRR